MRPGNPAPGLPSLTSFGQALAQAAEAQSFLFCYEGGGKAFPAWLTEETKPFPCSLGPRAVFSMAEAEAVQKAGGVPVTLGKRILRTETAPLAALSVVMYASGNMEP